MNKLILVFSIFAMGMFIQACTKDSSSLDDESIYATEEISEIQNRTLTGKGGCFELIFPISIVLPDGVEIEVSSYDNMKKALRDWKKNNPDADRKIRPEFVFPIDIVNQEGVTITIASKEELIAVRKECKVEGHGPHGGGGPHGGHGRECFKLSFPLSVLFPDATTTTFETSKAMKEALRAWKKANPTSTARPELVFPVTVTLRDGTSKTVASKEELAQLKADCK